VDIQKVILYRLDQILGLIKAMCGILRKLLANPSFQRTGAKLILRLAPRLTWKNTTILSRWSDVREVLSRDLDFVIEPVNKERIERINGPFILGLDRSTTHLHEREILYKALNPDDIPRIQNTAAENARSLLESIGAGGSIDVVNGYARRVASRSASALMGVEGPNEDDQMRVARAMFHELFLNLGEDKKVREKALEASEELRTWIAKNITARRKSQTPSEDMISRLIALGVEDDLIRRTVSGMFVGAIDTTATCVAQIMDVILKRPHLKRQIMRDLDNPLKMRGWCYEALRFWPHNPVVLRQAARDCTVDGYKIKAGANVVCFTLAAMHDASAFPKPSLADPNRPNEYYLHFGGGLHPCAGRAINGVQIPTLVTELLRRDPLLRGDMEHDGPFPDKLILKLQS
jgi:cytochrome P450